jgi:RNA processing factor Prp31
MMRKSKHEEILSRAQKGREEILSEKLREVATSVEHGTFRETPQEWINLVETMFNAADQLDKYVELAEKRRVR